MRLAFDFPLYSIQVYDLSLQDVVTLSGVSLPSLKPLSGKTTQTQSAVSHDYISSLGDYKD